MRTPANIARHPIHPMLVAIPIGLWIFSLICDLVYRFGGGNPNWQVVAWYTLVGGILGALVAAGVPRRGAVSSIPSIGGAMRKVRVAPKGMGLNDFVAKEEGFFAAEGIEVEWDMKTFRGTQASWKGNDYFQRPQDKPYTEGDKSVIQCACVWGSISNASAGMGRFVPDCYGVSPWAIFVRPG